MRLGASCPFFCVAHRGFLSLCLLWPPVLRCTPLHSHYLCPLYLPARVPWAGSQIGPSAHPSQAERTRQRAIHPIPVPF